MSRDLCGLVCPSRTSERGGEGDCVKEGGRGEGERERDGTREEPGTLTQGGALFSLVPLVWESKTPGWLVQAQPPAQRGSGAHPVCVYYCSVCLFLQYLLQSCARGGRRRVEDMCYERLRAEACVDDFVTL